MRAPNPRTLIYLFAFFFPPILIGVVRLFSTAGQVLIQPVPKAIEEKLIPPVAQLASDGKPTALILLSNASTQVTELLAAYQALAEAGFRVVTAAPERKLSATTGAVAVLPDTTLDQAPNADLLVIPAVVDFNNEKLVEFARGSKAPKVLVLGEGGRLAALAGLLQGKKATTHFNALEEERKNHPDTQWTGAQDYVADGRVFTTAGLDATVAAMPAAVAWAKGQSLPEAPTHAEASLTAADLATIFLHGGYTFIPRSLGIYLSDGVDETALAALLDTFPRTMSSLMATWGDERRILKSKNGLSLIPTQDVLKQAELPDVLAIPEGAKLGPEAEKWVKTTGLPTAAFPKTPSARTELFPQALEWLKESPFDLGDAVPLVAKFTQTRGAKSAESSGAGALAWLYRPILVGLLGMLVARWILGRLGKKSAVTSR